MRIVFSMMLAGALCAGAGGPSPVRAQTPAAPQIFERTVPDTAWQRLTAPPKFAYRDELEGVKPPPPPPKPSLLVKVLTAIIRFFATAAGVVLLWCVLIGALAYVVYQFMLRDGRFSVRRAKKIPGAGGEMSEADLEGTDWMHLFEEAAAGGYLRAAVRYGYLHILQQLQEQDFILHRPDKTNGDYLQELAGKPQAPLFRSLARRYEYAWYGEYPLNAAQFAAYRGEMTALQNTMRA